MVSLSNALLLASAVLCFRTLPVALWAMVFGRSRLLILFLFTAPLVFLVHSGVDVQEVLVRAPLALVYFSCVGMLFYEIRGFGKDGLLNSLLIGIALFLLLIWGPVMAVGRSPLLGPMLIMAWELWFAAYNLFHRHRPDLTRKQALFFLLVDPSLVFEQRAEPCDKQPTSILRVCAGLGSLIADTAVRLLILYFGLRSIDLFMIFDVTSGLGFLQYNAAVAIAYYCAHSGLASIQIGLLGLLGYRCQERYQFPFLATSPADFWNRWNRWLGGWGYLHIFVPVARTAKRRFPSLGRNAGRLGLLATFLFVGLAHDVLPIIAQDHVIRFPVTLAFLFIALASILWRLVAARTARAHRTLPRWLRVPVSRALLWLTMSVFAWLLFPALELRQFPVGLMVFFQ